MEWNTRKKICGAVLTLAASGFGVDRWMLGPGPAEADAGTAVGQANAIIAAAAAPSAKPPAATVLATAADKKGPAGETAPARSLAARLQDVATAERLDVAAVPDAFQASKLWKPPVPVVTAAARPAAPPAPPPPDPAVEFRATHKLTAVMQLRTGSPGGGLAMIDGKTVVSGELVGNSGFVLVAVRKDAALFRKGTSQVVLPLEVPGAKK